MKRLATLALFAAAGVVTSAARAGTINPVLKVDGTSGTLSAEAQFSVIGNNLQIQLTNLSSSDVVVSSDVLTGLFFDITGKPTLTPVSATINAGSSVEYGSYPTSGNVGGEWAFNNALSGAPGSASYGVGAAGFGLFGPSDLIGGPNLTGQTAVGGLDWGLTSAGDDSSTGNGGVVGTPLIKNSMTFELAGLPSKFNLNNINNVHFQYGTSTSEPGFPETSAVVSTVPEPATPTLLIAGAAMLLTRRRRKGMEPAQA